jgi:ribosome-associated translation inhibitor RaiA
LLERATVRFEDVNGPKGGDDTVCRIKLVISGRPSLIAEHRAANPPAAFAQAIDKIQRALERTRDKHGLSVRGRRGSRPSKHRKHAAPADNGELIGRRVGRGRDALDSALERPEKQRRDAYVDTASPAVSATDRKAGGNATARRNTRAKHTRATATLEDSRTRPSRKSTRRSANRAKSSQGKERTAVAVSMTPGARASRR